MHGTFRALQHPAFALLWTGQTISRLGDALYRIALAWWVLEQTGSAAAMGTVLICSILPMVLLVLFGGVLVDRLPRRRVMLVSDVLSGLVVAVITVLSAADALVLWHIYVAASIFGIVSAAFEPAYVAYIPEIAPPELRTSANALTGLSGQIAQIGGPALGALLIATGGSTLAFGINAASFALSALCLLGVRGAQQRLRSSELVHAPTNTLAPADAQFHGQQHPSERTHAIADTTMPQQAKPDEPTSNTTSMWHDLRLGLQTTASIPWLWVTILVAALANVTAGAVMGTSLPLLVEHHFGDVGALGMLLAASAAGAVGVSLLLGRWPRIRWRGLLAYGGIILSSLAMIGLGLVAYLPLAAALSALFGVGIAVFGQCWASTLQEMVPADQLGRVSSLDFLGSFALLPIGYWVAGLLSDQFGPGLIFVIGGTLTALMHALALLHPDVRKVD